MLKDSLASKLSEGTAKVPRIISWWPRHASSCMGYIQARLSTSEFEVHRNDLMRLSQEWEENVTSAVRRRTGASLGLMCEHSALEISLVDAVVETNPESIESSASKLIDNVNAHGVRYAKVNKVFPRHRFTSLFNSHVTIMIALINARLDNDEGMFRKYIERNNENAAALAAFSAEWF